MLYNLDRLAPSIRNDIQNNANLRRFFNQKPETMLSIDTNAKTVKGQKNGYMTAILYLAPSNQSGVNLCPMAQIASCDIACLFTAGRGAMSNVFYARLRKALFWAQYQSEAIDTIKNDIKRAQKQATKKGLILLVRLNGTSDIRFENYGIIQSFPNIQFYDYTKIPNRKNLPANYDLTFSYSGVNTFAPYVKTAIDNGLRIAAVFRTREGIENAIANGIKFLGLELIDGDNSDIRHIEPHGVIVALYAKGRAKNDGTGFVVDIPAFSY